MAERPRGRDEAARDSPPDASREVASGAFSFRAVRVFVALQEAGSIAQAARQLGVSASGVSQQITALEQSVGGRLFDRKSRPIALTTAGQVFSTHAHRILQAAADAKAEMAARRLVALPQLNLAIIDDLDATLTPALVLDLKQRFPDCFIRTYSGRSDRIAERLGGRSADIAVSAALPDDIAAFEIHPLLKESYLLVAAKDVLTEDRPISEQLGALPLVRYSETMPIGRAVDAHLRRVGLNPPRRFAFEASRSVLAMVAAARGWTITPPLTLLDGERFLSALDLRPLPFAGMSRRIHLLSRRDEFGGLPAELAADCRALIQRMAVPRFDTLSPRNAGAIVIEES